MQKVNGKVWIENVDFDVKDVSQLDPKIYRIPMKLMQVGGNIEIGPGIPTETGNGIYCANLTMEQISDQITQLLNAKENEERDHEEQQEESDELSMMEASIERLGENSENEIDNILVSIYRISKNYRLGKMHLYMGVDVDSALNSLIADYEKNVVPKINDLSINAKKELLEKLQDVLNNPIFRIEEDFFRDAIKRINTSLNLPQEGSVPRQK